MSKKWIVFVGTLLALLAFQRDHSERISRLARRRAARRQRYWGWRDA